ncbi:hypothetical protein HHL16_02800 [Pseudoflavitalea sp. G-6-1-2]|uniref:hypothetical protein n=1 Tax=Pseudoflavitalea sp. G-6-1-2 TaxID=2728841 RepID=UPI00146B1F82|nr:hypothetical protein [Pseudoflavitalea sp. G-6-1-2]NML19781.1 hypothetical protein [Pseudoflavitalea sp. G-6-1-2]
MFVKENLSPIFDIQDNGAEDFEQRLAEKINLLVANDFSGLVNILYRIDVSELKVRQALKDNPDQDAGSLIATLIIARMLHKYKMREQFRPNSDIPDDEKW